MTNRDPVDAARRSSVRRLVHVGTEAALMAGQPLVNVDETAPLRPDSKAPYSASKAAADGSPVPFRDFVTALVATRA